jgi:hypothetical protein
VLTRGSLTAWAVRWDETGTAMAVWTLGAGTAATAGSSSQPGATGSATADASASASDASPSATPPQPPDASHISVDVPPARSGDPVVSAQPVASPPVESAASGTPATPAGRLSLYRVNAETRLADLEHPMLDAASADGGFSLRTGRLAWTSRSAAGELLLQVLAWSGDAIGRLDLPASTGAMIVP